MLQATAEAADPVVMGPIRTFLHKYRADRGARIETGTPKPSAARTSDD